MIYLIGGAARSGKSLIARRFLAQTGIPYFCLDWLMMGFANGMPEFQVDPEDDEWQIGEKIWPLLRGMIKAMDEDRITYLFEGAQLTPRHAWDLYQQYEGRVRACFIGYAGIDSKAKLRQIRQHGGNLNDWLRAYDDTRVLAEIERMKMFSDRVRSQCDQYGMAYFETGLDLEEAITTVVRYLTDN